MLVPLERLIDGVIETLENEVLPEVGSAFARGQLHAALDVLANLRDRIEPKAALATADADAAAAALSELAAKLREAGREAEAGRVAAAVAAAPEQPPAARAEALREAVRAALALLAELPEETASPLHPVLRGYLVGQAVRDVLTLKGSRLERIAKG